MLGKIIYVINFARCINKAILCSLNNDVHRMEEEFLSIRDKRIKISVVPTLYTITPSMKIQFPEERNS
jgi:hypothetical protein